MSSAHACRVDINMDKMTSRDMKEDDATLFLAGNVTTSNLIGIKNRNVHDITFIYAY